MSKKDATRPAATHWIVWLLLGVILLGAILIRWRLRDCPLERDEGEYAYLGQLLLKGVAPYGVAGNHKFPGIYLAYAAIMAVFGQSAAGIHIGMLLVNLANTVLLFVLGRRISGNVVGLAGAVAWVVMSASPGVYGNAGHLTHFVVLAVLSAAVLLWTGTRWSLAGAGLCLGASVVFRQTSLVFVAFAAVFVWLETHDGRAKRTATIIAAALVPVLLMALWVWIAGVFPQFWRWAFTQAAGYGAQVSAADGLKQFLAATPAVIGWNGVLWLGAAVGLALALLDRTKSGWFLVGLWAAGTIALLPGLYFREHYYIQVLPAIALLFGHAVQKAWRADGWLRYTAGVGVSVALALPLFGQRDYFFASSPTVLARLVYGANPFPETMELARYIREHTAPEDPVAVLGSEPQIFFYAQRRSATSLIYTYPLMERHASAHGMQETMAREIEKAAPKFIVVVNVSASWLTRPDSDDFIFTWARAFLEREYRLEGLADILAGESRYVWGSEAANYQPQSPYYLSLYRRVP